VMRRAQVHAELAEIVAGGKAARQSRDEIVVFDSTGIAIEDAAAAIAVFEHANRTGYRSAFRLTE
jgi:alanine dehydrogenase